MDACEILLDTNLALHFPRLDQINWPALSGCKACTIVIAPILLRELEQKKIFGATPVLKETGEPDDRLPAWQDVGLRSDSGATGVTLLFMESEPAIDFASHNLVREVNDDHYIASAFERHARTGSATMIASNDGGMALKLRSRPISILRLRRSCACRPNPIPATRNCAIRRSSFSSCRRNARSSRRRSPEASGSGRSGTPGRSRHERLPWRRSRRRIFRCASRRHRQGGPTRHSAARSRRSARCAAPSSPAVPMPSNTTTRPCQFLCGARELHRGHGRVGGESPPQRDDRRRAS